MYCRSYLKRKTSSERLLTEFRTEVDKLIADIDAITDRDQLLVEERIKTLRGILEDVDKRINVYIREIDRKKVQEEAYLELGKKRSMVNISQEYIAKVPENPPAQTQKDIITEEKDISEKNNIETATIPEENPIQESQTPTVPRIVISPQQIKPKPLPLTEQVAELSKAGLSTRLIALRLGVSISEVELAIAMSDGNSSE